MSMHATAKTEKTVTIIHYYLMALNTERKMMKKQHPILFHSYPPQSCNRQTFNATPSHWVSSALFRIRDLCINDRGVRRLYILISSQCTHCISFHAMTREANKNNHKVIREVFQNHTFTRSQQLSGMSEDCLASWFKNSWSCWVPIVILNMSSLMFFWFWFQEWI